MPEDRAHTLHVGSEAGGFRITHTPGGRVLELECWGYWDDDTASAFTKHAAGALGKVGTPLEVTWDASLLKPQSSEGQAAIRGLMKRLAATALGRVTVLSTNVLTRMQLTRLAREAGLDSLRFSNQPSTKPPAKS